MGTNYYWIKNECPTCGHAEMIHIGKSSYGWPFHFHGTNEIRSYKDWLEVLREGKIEDEYGKEVPLDKLKALIERKRETSKCAAVIGKNDWVDDEGNVFCDCDFS